MSVMAIAFVVLLTSGIESLSLSITGRQSKLLEDRAKTLGITYLYQGQHNKLFGVSTTVEDTH